MEGSSKAKTDMSLPEGTTLGSGSIKVDELGTDFALKSLQAYYGEDITKSKFWAGTSSEIIDANKTAVAKALIGILRSSLGESLDSENETHVATWIEAIPGSVKMTSESLKKNNWKKLTRTPGFSSTSSGQEQFRALISSAREARAAADGHHTRQSLMQEALFLNYIRDTCALFAEYAGASDMLSMLSAGYRETPQIQFKTIRELVSDFQQGIAEHYQSHPPVYEQGSKAIESKYEAIGETIIALTQDRLDKDVFDATVATRRQSRDLYLQEMRNRAEKYARRVRQESQTSLGSRGADRRMEVEAYSKVDGVLTSVFEALDLTEQLVQTAGRRT